MLWASSSPWGLLLLLPQRGLGWAVTATFNPSGSRSPILTEGPLSTAAGRDTGPILLSPSAVPSAQSQPSVVTWAAAQMTLQPRQSPSQATGKHPGPQQPSCLLTPQGSFQGNPTPTRRNSDHEGGGEALMPGGLDRRVSPEPPNQAFVTSPISTPPGTSTPPCPPPWRCGYSHVLTQPAVSLQHPQLAPWSAEQVSKQNERSPASRSPELLAKMQILGPCLRLMIPRQPQWEGGPGMCSVNHLTRVSWSIPDLQA